MKKSVRTILACGALLATSSAFSQDLFAPNGVGASTTGRVGIGTNAPGSTLHLNAGNPTIRLQDNTAGGNDYGFINNQSGNDVLNFAVWNFTDNRAEMSFDGDGNVAILNGNLGIGTFQIQNSFERFLDTRTRNDFFLDTDNDQTGESWRFYINGSTEGSSFHAAQIGGDNQHTFFAMNPNNFGIGTTAPSEKLDVNGNIAWGTTGSRLKTDQGGSILLQGGTSATPYIQFQRGTTGNTDVKMVLIDDNTLKIQSDLVSIGSTAGANGKAFEIFDGNDEVFQIMGDGSTWATEFHVALRGEFPDYVFAPSYELMPLSQLQTYIEANSKLPGIPSAEEVKQDGLSLADMQVRQMEKIEELTLYILQLKEEIDSLKSQVEGTTK